MRKIVKPVGDTVILDPYGRRVPEDGAIVIWSSWWDRRLRDGGMSVHEVEEPATAAPKPRKSNKSTEESDK